jgi:hypothetical protein
MFNLYALAACISMTTAYKLLAFVTRFQNCWLIIIGILTVRTKQTIHMHDDRIVQLDFYQSVLHCI